MDITNALYAKMQDNIKKIEEHCEILEKYRARQHEIMQDKGNKDLEKICINSIKQLRKENEEICKIIATHY